MGCGTGRPCKETPGRLGTYYAGGRGLDIRIDKFFLGNNGVGSVSYAARKRGTMVGVYVGFDQRE
jgi:hypothetical protein